MIGIILRRAAQSAFAAVAAFGLPLAADAAQMNIHLTDMDVTYMAGTSGGSIFDAMGGFSGGSFAEATSDNITSADFEVVGSGNVASRSNTAADGDDIHIDLRVTNIGAITKNNLFSDVGNNGFDFGLDYFTDTGDRLSLDTDEVSILINDFVFLVTGAVQLDPDDPQILPAGLAFDPTQPIQFSFIANFPSVPAGPTGTTISIASGSGVLTISGTLIPEPAACTMLVSGLAIFGVGMLDARRRRAWNLAALARE